MYVHRPADIHITFPQIDITTHHYKLPSTMATAASNDAEAQFLEARKSRAENARLHTDRRRRTDDLQDFWAAFKAFRSAWTRKLEQIQREESASTSTSASTDIDMDIHTRGSDNEAVALPLVVSESDKRRVRLELCGLQDELELRRKQCFSQAPAAIQMIQHDDAQPQQQTSSLSSFPAFTLPAHELPLPDLRLLHAEFTQCRAELDRKRNMLLPKGKFVFQRYREAIQLQQDANMMTDADKSTIDSSSPTELLQLMPVPAVSDSSSVSVAAATAHRDSKHTLENVSDCEIQVYTDGRVRISCKKKQEESEDSTMDRILQLEALDSSPLVLSNIQNSNVVM
jgi:hypothetical protein